MMLLFQYSFMMPAITACLLLAGIHTYFGYHIVKREVIFVDLAISQIAALGASVCLLSGWGEEMQIRTFAIGLLFTFAGALLFAFLRKCQNVVPMEAFIGIVYAGAMAASLLVLEKSATGTEHVKEMLVGTILTVSWHDVLQLGGIIASVAVLHAVFYRKFFIISENPQKAVGMRMKLWIWDTLFYATFGVVVTSSVKIAGVLLIFSLLTIPAVTAAIIAGKNYNRLIIGWVFGIGACLAGLEVSLRIDSAAGPSIIASMISMMLILSIVFVIVKHMFYKKKTKYTRYRQGAGHKGVNHY